MKIVTAIRKTQPGRRGVLLLLAVLLPVVALLWRDAAPTRAAAAPSRAAGNGRIYFASDRTGDWEIFAINPDGTGTVNLTQSPDTKDERPGASPDGTKIAFGRTVGSNTDIWVMNADGSNQKRLTTAPQLDHAPQWSPDGTKIAFRSDREGQAEIFVMNADGSNQTRLTNHPAHDHGPDWSPDGTKIVFSSDRNDNDDVYVMNADGSNVTRITTHPHSDFGASWSPLGDRFVFRSDRDGAPEVYIMNIDGSNQKNLSNNAAFDRGPAWSPDGSKVIFYSNRDGDYELYMMNPDGSNPTRLTFAKGRDFQPDWASDGTVTPPTCYTLSRDHTGQGGDPTAAPNSSGGCGAGKYTSGTTITLTAAPAAGWHVGGWTGTSNDSSTATTNTLVMPAANHTAAVAYEQDTTACYTLERDHTGQGGDPTAAPANSPGCPSGQYTPGATITLTAAPSVGWHVVGWTGTSNDSSTATTNSLVMPAAHHTTAVAYEQDTPECYPLERNRTGNGSIPTASPAYSAGCPSGQYTPGETITLSAAPAAGWHVAGWTGTTNNSSTAATNTVAMPARAHTATVIYQQMVIECYPLMLSHTGQGANPTAAPAASSGCPAGYYWAGATITLTASPAAGWHVSGWSGTNDDAATTATNTVIMPTAAHAAAVAYEQNGPTCYALALEHTGQGGDPAAAPAASPGCAAGQYTAGEIVTLSAAPAMGWHVSGWTGTSDDAATAATNSVVMPDHNHAAGVIYEATPPACHALTPTHSGPGSDPTAAPAHSDGCPAGHYTAGETISLTAAPAAGWRVAGWSGTADDSSTAATNTLTMPDAPHQVSVTYEPEPGQTWVLFLPVVSSDE